MGRFSRKDRRWVEFEFWGQPRSEVFVAGTFNGWNPAEIVMRENGDGAYATSLLLTPGRYEYKFIVNGQWVADPNCPDSIQNGHGSVNSAMTVA